ncbi:MAG: hypothetical protein GY771_10505 [bacterium]|nr:hypothetical protein [bacterium]
MTAPKAPPFFICVLVLIGYNISVGNGKNENNINRRGFISLLLTGGIAFALGGVATLFKKRRPEETALPDNIKPAAYWRRVK